MIGRGHKCPRNKIRSMDSQPISQLPNYLQIYGNVANQTLLLSEYSSTIFKELGNILVPLTLQTGWRKLLR